ncbi:MAG: hypothetical protein ACRCTF_02505 [Bacteroidales bacterium]
MEPKNTITFRIGDETRPILEDKNLKESIFFDLYQKSFVEIDKYIAKVETLKDEANGYKYEGINNIFAFIGERGAGKSSCMMSVGRILEKGDTDVYKELELTNKVDGILRHKFINSILIDPSFFDQQNNILSLIIAHLFKTFRDKVSDTNCKIDIDKKRKVIDSFERVQRNLKHFFEFDKSNTDSLDSLVNFAATVDLQNDIKSLIDSYLDFISDDKNGFLVLMIDDIDLHTEHARDMVEQVRKYFIQQNIIVLMAVKIDQLSNVIKNNLSKEYKVLIDNKAIDFDVINEMVERYLGKLIPHSHRIYLPDATVHYYSKLKIVKDSDSDIQYKESDELPEVRDRVLSLIYERTEFSFYNSIDSTSYIIPRNLRELRNLMAMLINMTDDNTTSMGIKYSRYNRSLFIKYFLDTWCSNNLSIKGKNDLLNLFLLTDALQINKCCLLILSTQFKDELDNIELDNEELEVADNSTDSTNYSHNIYSEYTASFDDKLKSEVKSILSVNNFSYNISLGDILTIIDYLNLIVYSDEKRKLIFALKFFYSMRLSEYIKELIDKESPVYGLYDDKSTERKEKSSRILSNNRMSNIPNYTKLTAGSVINTESFQLLRKESNKISRSRRKIDISTLKDLLNNDDDLFSAGDPKLLEFFLLAISMRQDQEKKDISFRSQTKIRFLNDCNSITIAWFDLASIFFNILDIKESYSRFKNGKTLFNSALTNKNSLLFKIITRAVEVEYGEINESDDWLKVLTNKDPKIDTPEKGYEYILPIIRSLVAVTNIEIFEDLKYFLIQEMPKTDKNWKHFKEYFTNLSSYKSDSLNHNDWTIFDVFTDIFESKKDLFEQIITSNTGKNSSKANAKSPNKTKNKKNNTSTSKQSDNDNINVNTKDDSNTKISENASVSIDDNGQTSLM